VPVGGLILAAMLAYWLMGRSQRRWWLLASAAVSIVVLAFLLAEPFTQAYKPLGSLPLELRIAELAARTGVPRSAIVIEHCDPASSCPPGRVIGMGPTRLMLLNDALLAQNPESWTLQTVAHEAKHFSKDDNIKAFFLLSGLALAALWFVNHAGHAIVARWSGRLGFAGLEEPASLPLAVLLLSSFYVAALAPVNLFRQHVELEADRFALELTRENATQARMTASWASEKSRVPEWAHSFSSFGHLTPRMPNVSGWPTRTILGWRANRLCTPKILLRLCRSNSIPQMRPSLARRTRAAECESTRRCGGRRNT